MKKGCCGPKRRSDTHDAYYCRQCGRWLEKKCRDRRCEFCRARPKVGPRELRLRAKCSMSAGGGHGRPLILGIEAVRGKEHFYLELVLSKHCARVLTELLVSAPNFDPPMERGAVLKVIEGVENGLGWTGFMGTPAGLVWAAACREVRAKLAPESGKT